MNIFYISLTEKLMKDLTSNSEELDLERCLNNIYKINLIIININMILSMDLPLEKKYTCNN